MSVTVYEIITGQIIAQLEKGVAPWRQPWSEYSGESVPLILEESVPPNSGWI